MRRQAGEMEPIHGLGITVQYNRLTGQTLIMVTDEELRHNPLARAWVEALENMESAGKRQLDFLARQFLRTDVNLGERNKHAQP